jgi:hypothetical protein
MRLTVLLVGLVLAGTTACSGTEPSQLAGPAGTTASPASATAKAGPASPIAAPGSRSTPRSPAAPLPRLNAAQAVSALTHSGYKCERLDRLRDRRDRQVPAPNPRAGARERAGADRRLVRSASRQGGSTDHGGRLARRAVHRGRHRRAGCSPDLAGQALHRELPDGVSLEPARGLPGGPGITTSPSSEPELGEAKSTTRCGLVAVLRRGGPGPAGRGGPARVISR